jgi:hypothetical protein
VNDLLNAVRWPGGHRLVLANLEARRLFVVREVE